MPFSGVVFSNVSGAETAAPGQIVQSTVWNNIHTDYGTALTQLMSQVTTLISNRNLLEANGSADVWQRGAGNTASIAVAASTTAYTTDRWYIVTGANQASVIAATTPLSDESFLSANILRNAGQTGTTALTFGYPFGARELARILGNKVTLSGLIKAGANFSPTNGTLTVAFYVGTGTASKRGAGFTSETTVVSISTNLTPGGATVAISGVSANTVPLTSTQGEVQFTWTPVGTAGAADSFTFDDMQLESNLSASTWTGTSYDRIPFLQQIAFCKEHYQKTFTYSTAPAQNAGALGALAVVAQATSRVSIWWEFPVEFRTTPTITTFNTSGANENWQNITTVATSAVTVVASITNSKSTVFVTATVALDNFLYIQAQADAGI